MQAQPATAVEKKLSPARCRVAHAWLTNESYDRLTKIADRRRQHPDALVAEIIDLLLCADAVEALLAR